MHDTIKKAVFAWLRHHPEAEYLRDELVGDATLAVVKSLPGFDRLKSRLPTYVTTVVQRSCARPLRQWARRARPERNAARREAVRHTLVLDTADVVRRVLHRLNAEQLDEARAMLEVLR